MWTVHIALFPYLFVQRFLFSAWLGANCLVGMSYYVECLRLLFFFKLVTHAPVHQM